MKRIFLLMLFNIIYINVNAQISEEIFGLTLAKSNTNQLEALLKKNNLKYQINEDKDTYTINNVEYDGISWESVIIMTCDRIVCRIAFISKTYNSTVAYSNYLRRWNTNYSNYRNDNSKIYENEFTDGKTRVGVDYSYEEDKFYYSFENVVLLEAAMNSMLMKILQNQLE